MNKWLRVVYLPRTTYISLIEAKKTTEEIIKLATFYGDPKDISALTSAIISRTNNVINRVFFNEELPAICSPNVVNKISTIEENYVRDFVDDYLKTSEMVEFEKCCEIVLNSTADEVTLLVVVEKGFLSFVAETKEKLSEHFLTLLRHSHDQGCNYNQIGHKYLGLKMNKGYLDLVKLRLDRR